MKKDKPMGKGSMGKKKPPFTTAPGKPAAMCKKCGKPYGKKPGSCTC